MSLELRIWNPRKTPNSIFHLLLLPYTGRAQEARGSVDWVGRELISCGGSGSSTPRAARTRRGRSLATCSLWPSGHKHQQYAAAVAAAGWALAAAAAGGVARWAQDEEGGCSVTIPDNWMELGENVARIWGRTGRNMAESVGFGLLGGGLRVLFFVGSFITTAPLITAGNWPPFGAFTHAHDHRIPSHLMHDLYVYLCKCIIQDRRRSCQ
jgi:hypothetical protein